MPHRACCDLCLSPLPIVSDRCARLRRHARLLVHDRQVRIQFVESHQWPKRPEDPIQNLAAMLEAHPQFVESAPKAELRRVSGLARLQLCNAALEAETDVRHP